MGQIIGPINKTDWTILKYLKKSMDALRFKSDRQKERKDKKDVFNYILSEYLGGP